MTLPTTPHEGVKGGHKRRKWRLSRDYDND
jgi:hypothetical protein